MAAAPHPLALRSDPRRRIEPVILKVGGSAITRKKENLREVRDDVLERIAGEIARALGAWRSLEGDEAGIAPARALVLVHGAGPFGHDLVARHGIRDGVFTPRHVEGWVRTRLSMRDLNLAVVDRLAARGLLPFPIPPSAFVIQREKRIAAFDTSVIEHLLSLDANLIPVLHGDMVADTAIGASVVSGDVIVPCLAAALGARHVLLGTDVKGVYEPYPPAPGQPPIPRIDEDRLVALAGSLREASGAAPGRESVVDVTGGMRRKLESIAEMLRPPAGAPGSAAAARPRVLIFDALEPGNVYRALMGEPAGGTEIG